MRPRARPSLTQRRSTVAGTTARPACQPSRVIGLRAVPCLALPRRGAVSASDPENNGPPSFRTAKTRPRNGRRSPPPMGACRRRARARPTPMRRGLRPPPAVRQSERRERRTSGESTARRELRTAPHAACTAPCTFCIPRAGAFESPRRGEGDARDGARRKFPWEIIRFFLPLSAQPWKVKKEGETRWRFDTSSRNFSIALQVFVFAGAK